MDELAVGAVDSLESEEVPSKKKEQRKKEYPINIQPYYEHQSEPSGWWSRGHHSYEDFVAAVVDSGYNPGEGAAASFLNEWWRSIPYSGGYCYCVTQPNSRGSFPVTVLEDNDAVREYKNRTENADG